MLSSVQGALPFCTHTRGVWTHILQAVHFQLYKKLQRAQPVGEVPEVSQRNIGKLPEVDYEGCFHAKLG